MLGVDGPVRGVLDAADAIDAGDSERALAILDEMAGEQDGLDSAAHRLARLFTLGLRTRLTGHGSGSGNLYLAAPGDGVDMIGAFDVLVETTPFIRFAYASATAAIAAIPATTLHIVDIGIGEGRQWPSLFHVLATRPDPPQVRLTGIDLPATADDAASRLRAVGERLAACAGGLGLVFSYRGIPAAMEDVRGDELDLRDGEMLVINLALALHHTATDTTAGPSARDAILERLYALSPAMLVLVEPDSEHDELPFRLRVAEALSHYGAIFRALDSLVPAANPARSVLEEQFFGREILNVVGFEGAQRVERHQRHRRWVRRFEAAGFRTVDLSAHAAAVSEQATVRPPAEVVVDAGVLVLQWDGTPLLSASAWTV